jgi:hypothetical protein
MQLTQNRVKVYDQSLNVGKAVLVCIREVPRANLWTETGYPDVHGFPQFLQGIAVVGP